MKNTFKSCNEAYEYFYNNLTVEEIADEVRAVVPDLDLINAYEAADSEEYHKIIDTMIWDKIEKANIKEE